MLFSFKACGTLFSGGCYKCNFHQCAVLFPYCVETYWGSVQQAHQISLLLPCACPPCLLQTLANKQRQLLHTVQQQCQAAGLQPLFAPHGSSNSSSSSRSLQPDYAWALNMVKSRTFGQKLPQLVAQAAAGATAPTAPAAAAAAAAAATAVAAATPLAAVTAAAAAASAASQELEDDDNGVVLLMAPYIDMINHAPYNNCVFGIDPDGRR
jgi:hypothetical protein